MREARTRALELKKMKTAQNKEQKSEPKEKDGANKKAEAAENAPPPKMNLSAESNLSEDLQEFEKDLCGEYDAEDERNGSSGTIYVQETSSGMR